MENVWMAHFENSRMVEVNCFYQVIIYVETSLFQMGLETLLSMRCNWQASSKLGRRGKGLYALALDYQNRQYMVHRMATM